MNVSPYPVPRVRKASLPSRRRYRRSSQPMLQAIMQNHVTGTSRYGGEPSPPERTAVTASQVRIDATEGPATDRRSDATRFHTRASESSVPTGGPPCGEIRACCSHCFRDATSPDRMTPSATSPHPGQGRPGRLRGARFRRGLLAPAEVADAAPATALRPEEPCCAKARRCPDCPRAATRTALSARS
jgi:hypothetical protein